MNRYATTHLGLLDVLVKKDITLKITMKHVQVHDAYLYIYVYFSC